MTHDAEGRVRAWRAFAATNRTGYDHLADVSYGAVGYPIGDADLDELLQALADTRDENDRLGTEAATETSRRELFQDALAEVQTERDRLRTELADTRQRLDEASRRMRTCAAAIEQRARAEDATGIASVYCAWWDASALVDETLDLPAEPTRQGYDTTTSEGN